MLVTDAMPCVGTDQRTFMLQGRRISVEDGYCVDEQGTLAGTALTMAAAVRNAVALLGVELSEAIAMASEVPASFLGLAGRLGRIAAREQANLVEADDDLNVTATWIDGERNTG